MALFFTLLVLGLVLISPARRILRRTGLPAWWAVLVFLPFGAVIFFWLVAFKDWSETANA